MLRAPIVWLAVFLVLGCCQGARTSKPVLTPADPEIIINEGESLKLICTGSERMKFHYPDNDGQSMYLLPTSPVTVEETGVGIDNWHHRIVLRRANSVAGDTGWYGCSSAEDNITLGDYDEPRVSWTYVYVKSNSSYFVNTDELEMLNAVLGTPVKIPCRPTSPDHNVLLTVSNQEITMGNTASYDPKTGFILKKFSLKDNGYVTCSISEVNTAEVRFFLRVTRPSKLSEPTIISDTLRHVVRGQTLYVNCTTVLDMDAQYFFNWTTPRQSSKITTRPHSKAIGVNKQLVTCELIIDGVTDEDQGAYTCTIKSHDASKSSTTFINVYDPEVKYINLTVDGNVQDHQKNYGDNVQWVVHVDAYPTPTLKWLDPSGKVINASWKDPTWSKYAIQTTYTTILTTILRINIVELADMGLYSLEATNVEQTKTLNFTLEVRAKPILMFGNLENFYMPNQEVKIPCNILAYPRPNVSCSYARAPNFPSWEGLQVLPLKVSVDQKASTTILSVVSMTINDPEFGNVTCRACNTVGCDLATVPIWVSDVPLGFDIIKPSTELTVGDELRVTCAASLYNYTSVMWEDEEEDLPADVEITRSQTKYTLRSELLIKNVGLDRNGSIFNCIAFKSDGGDDSYPYKVQIYDSEPPYFRETNMNKTEITFDLSAEEHPTVTLKCYVGGTPSPQLTWYKDDDVIEGNEQYMFLHKNQELHIKYLLDGNGGKYSCKAENRHGQLTNYQIFTIKGKEVSIAWIISMVILLIICVILVIYFSIKMHREKVMRKQLMEAGLTHFEEGALECLNPELTVDDQAELLPYDKKWEFPRERLKFGKQLGSGAFGVVMKAEARGICDEEAVTTVAVKMVRRSTEPTYIKALASELKIMIHLGKHLNVVNLLGACTKNITKRELLVIVEYCRFGNLHNYLLRHRADFINQIDPTSGKLDATIGLDILTRTTSVGSSNSLSANSHSCSTGAELVSYTAGTDPQSVSMSPDGCVLSNNSTQPGWRSNYSGDYKDQNLKPICTQDLLSWAFQVARGMEYLSQRKVLHGDLAARNILLAENNIVKICDFGLAKTMYKDDNYKKKGDAPLPIKWMAIESIRDRVFSTQSDIWSFGIVLWEFFTLAKTPYPGMEAEKQYQRLIEGYRMEKPEYATDEVYDIMLQCWKAKPTLRPTFTNLVASIGDLLEESVKEHYVDLNAPYLNMNTIVLESGKNDYLTMMSAPDHEALSSPTHYVNSPCLSPAGAQDEYLSMSPSSPGVESGIFSPRVLPAGNGKFQFPTSDPRGNVHSDSESEAVELSPMLTQEDDNYLKPINVRERRAEFAKQREAALKAAEMERAANDSGYCNAPRNLRLIDLNAADPTDDSEVDGTTRSAKEEKEPKGYAPTIIRTQDNYVNMPRQKNNLRKDAPDSFSNPSYIMMGTREIEQPGA